MRFLLHPRRSNLGKGSVSYVVSHPAVVTKARPAALYPNAPKDCEPSSNAVAVPADDRRLSRVPASTTLVPSPAPVVSRRRAWGQQCSEHCGCAVRFEAEIRGGTVVSASYHAKQLVPGLTAKGRPMFKACECSALRHLSGVVVDHMAGTPLSRLKNSLEFRSTRSSPSFRSAALRAQGLSEAAGAKCFDLVEEAVTALLKGHLPKPRPAVVPPRPDIPRSPWSAPGAPPKKQIELPRHAWLEAHRDYYSYDDDEEETFPNVFWRSASPSHHLDVGNHSHPSSTSALWLLDLENEDRTGAPSPLRRREGGDEVRRRGGGRLRRLRRRGVPRDWVSYVDELHWRQESSA